MTTDSPNSERTDAYCDVLNAPSVGLSWPSVVRDLGVLVDGDVKFPTIYADPPWPYSNTAARGAAENHYRTLSLDEIRGEPVKQLAAERAHLQPNTGWTVYGNQVERRLF